MKFKAFTVVDSGFKSRSGKSKFSKESGFDLMFSSALDKKIPFQIVVNNGRCDGSYYSKLLPIIDFLKSCDDDDLVLYVDAFDTIFLDNEEEIVRKFKLSEAKFLISGEIFCYPFDTLHDELLEKAKNYVKSGIYKIEPENSHLFRNPCAGMIIGYKSYFLTKALQWKDIIDKKEFPISNIVDKSIYEKSDQGASMIDYLKNEDFTRVDIYPRVFINHMYVSRDVFFINNGKLEFQKVLNPKQEFPSIIHFNGVTFPNIFDFVKALEASKNTSIKIENNLLHININTFLEKAFQINIYDSQNNIEYENTVSSNECDITRTISSKSVSNGSNFKIHLIYQNYTFFKQSF